jgi:hypothetical protein
MFGVFRVKNHDITPKIIFFPIVEGGAKMFGVFRVKNHDFTPKIIFFSILGGATPGTPWNCNCISGPSHADTVV